MMHSFCFLLLAWCAGETAPQPDPKRAEDLTTERPVRYLALDEYVHRVLLNDLDIKVSRLDRDITRVGVMEALGAFDPELYASATGSDEEVPTASVFSATSNQSLDAALGLRGLLRSGMQYDLGYTFRYNRQSPTNPFFDFNPTYTSSVGLDLTQPLLRGAGSTVTEATVQQNQILVQQADYTFYQAVQAKAFEAIQAYWNLVFSLRQLDTRRSAHEVAIELVGNNRRKVEAGIMTRIDVLQAEAEEARRWEDLIVAGTQLEDAEDLLKMLLNPGEDLEAWDVMYLPLTEPELREEELAPVADAVDLAFQHRPDLIAAEMEIARADLSLAVAENQQLPQFDLRGGLGYSGLAGKVSGAPSSGSVQAEIGDSNWENFQKSLRPIKEATYERWSVGLDLSHPIGNRTADAAYRRASLQKDRALLHWQVLRRNVVRDLRTALREVADAKARTEATARASLLAREQYEAEKIRLDNKSSTTFQVREAQRDMFEALDQETRAIVDYEIRQANLSLVMGTLAEQFGVVFRRPERLEGALID